jgi:hypothetical protein
VCPHHTAVDIQAGPVVRPYALTGGRTDPAGGTVLDLIAVIAASGPPPEFPAAHGPEHRRLLELCRRPITVADVAAETTLPIGVVRVLLADLIQQGMLTVLPARSSCQQASSDFLEEVLHGLRSL